MHRIESNKQNHNFSEKSSYKKKLLTKILGLFRTINTKFVNKLAICKK